MIFRISCLLFFVFFSFCIWLQSSYAASLSELKIALESYGIAYKKNIYIEEDFSIDLRSLDTTLKENYDNYIFEYEWNISWASTKTGPTLSRKFETSGQKNIGLSIYATEIPWETSPDETEEDTWDTSETPPEENLIISRDLVLQSDIWFFIYEQSVPLVVDESIKRKSVENFITAWRDLGIYVRELWSYSEFSIDGNELLWNLEEYKISTPQSSDYLILWWRKEFLFTTLSQLDASSMQNPLNMVLVSSFNTSILKNYIGNNIAGKQILKTAFIIDETLRLQILKNPTQIELLQTEVEQNNYAYTSLSEQNTLSPLLFVSQFINKLLSSGMPVSDIYIILLLPLFLTLVSFAKHLIGLSTIGIIVPVFIGLLFIKLSIIFTIWILLLFIICNIIISRFINKYALLYTPKVVCITIINIVMFMAIYQWITHFELINIPLNNVIYITLFFIIAERLITIITSKEFREYKKSISGTVIVAFLCYMMFQFDALRVFFMAYPETLLIFIPINFFIWRFTGLRVTEYLRFKEIINNAEE